MNQARKDKAAQSLGYADHAAFVADYPNFSKKMREASYRDWQLKNDQARWHDLYHNKPAPPINFFALIILIALALIGLVVVLNALGIRVGGGAD